MRYCLRCLKVSNETKCCLSTPTHLEKERIRFLSSTFPPPCKQKKTFVCLRISTQISSFYKLSPSWDLLTSSLLLHTNRTPDYCVPLTSWRRIIISWVCKCMRFCVFFIKWRKKWLKKELHWHWRNWENYWLFRVTWQFTFKNSRHSSWWWWWNLTILYNSSRTKIIKNHQVELEICRFISC